MSPMRVPRVSAELLKPVARYPLTKRLADHVHQLGRQKAAPLVGSGHVVSPSLCGMLKLKFADDTLAFLGPSLKRHQGCQILDFYPGPGLWSSKVHEYLKPKSHILIEPDQEAFLPFLQPLLDQPGSKYELCKLEQRKAFVTGSTGLVESWTPAKNSNEEDPSKNDDLLVLATVTRQQLKGIGVDFKTGYFNLGTNYFLYNYFQCLISQKGIHSSGRVRLLVWMTQQERLEYVAKSTRGMNPRSVSASAACDIQEIVGHGKDEKASAGYAIDTIKGMKGAPSLDLRGAIKVDEMTPSHKLALPANRRTHVQKQIIDGDRDVQTMTSELDELAGLERDAAHDKIAKKKDKPWTKKGEGVTQSPEWLRLIELRGKVEQILALPRYRRVNDKGRAAAALELEIIELEKEFVGLEEGSDQKVDVSRRMEDLRKLFTQKKELMQHGEHAIQQDIVNDQVALNVENPPMAWDNRRHEPLECEADEFWPRKQLALLDFDPATDPSNGIMIAKPLVQAIMRSDQETITQALESILPGGSDLIEQCPSITDPRQGGRLNPSDLRTRMMTVKMFSELAKAWEGWPFKVSDQMLRRQKSGMGMSNQDISLFE
ncbi:MAG: hypothetical protein M1828_003617 [Chrysothrix sp. TS-e1954]|nr:MAG: hypothetical protein M1828_003617 [Chrysothrix sp. TS-e1954]